MPTKIKRVVIESPFRGDVARNTLYLRHAIRDCYKRGESAYASHRMLTDALDDGVADERAWGIQAGLAWGEVAELCAVYIDLGVSSGMLQGVRAALSIGQPIEVRTIEGWGTETTPSLVALFDLFIARARAATTPAAELVIEAPSEAA